MRKIPEYLDECVNTHTDFPFNLEIHDRDTHMSVHRHNFAEFSYVIEGDGAELINGIRHDMLPGTFSLILPYQVHEIQVERGKSVRFFNCSMALDVFFRTQ